MMLCIRPLLVLLDATRSCSTGNGSCDTYVSSAWLHAWCFWSDTVFHFQYHRWQSKMWNVSLQMSKGPEKKRQLYFCVWIKIWKSMCISNSLSLFKSCPSDIYLASLDLSVDHLHRMLKEKNNEDREKLIVFKSPLSLLWYSKFIAKIVYIPMVVFANYPLERIDELICHNIRKLPNPTSGSWPTISNETLGEKYSYKCLIGL